MYRNENTAILRLTAVLVLVLIGLSTVLIAFRVEQVLLEVAQGRGLRAANQLREQIEGGFRLGLSLSDQSNLDDWLRRQGAQDASLVGAEVRSESGDVPARLGDSVPLRNLKPVWTQQLLGQGPYAASATSAILRNVGSVSYIGVPAADAAAKPVAVIWLAFDRTALRDSAWSMLHALWPYALAVAVVLIAVLTTMAAAWLKVARRRLQVAQEAAATDTPEARARGPGDLVEAVERTRLGRAGFWHEMALLLAAFVLIFAGLTTLAWKAREIARPLLVAQIDQSARTVLRSAQGHIDRALMLGVPADRLVGVEAMFVSELQPAAEIAFLALQLERGNAAAFSPRAGTGPEVRRAAQDWLAGKGGGGGFRIETQPLKSPTGESVGQLSIGTPVGYVDERVRSILLDLLFAVVVSLVLVREVLGAMWERSALKPYLAFESAWQGWRARARRLAAHPLGTAALDWLTEVRSGIRQLAQQAQARLAQAPLTGVNAELVRIRLMVFLTALSDELLRPFFTVFASEVSPVSALLSPTMLAGLPVAAFMLTLALAQPLGPWVTRRVEMRRALFGVALAGAVLLGITAFTTNGIVLVLLRAGSGVVYGLMLILSQTAIIRITDYGQRARGLVEVSAAIVAAGVCGPVLGGLLAERLGTVAAFAACTVCLVVAAAISLGLAPLPSDSRANLSGLGGWRGIAAVLAHRRVMAVTWFAAVPARLAAAALLVVVTPLYLLELGETATVAGRVLLLYFLAFMLAAPLVARRSDLSRRRKPWIIWGCALSAAACAALPLIGGVVGAAACCALLGIGQAVLSAPQLALVTETFDRDPHATQVVGATPEQALAAFRFIERFGSILAPFAVALAVAQFGLTGAVGAIGIVLAAGAAGVALALMNLQENPGTP